MACNISVFKIQHDRGASESLSSTTSSTPKMILSNPKKKAHAKKQPTGHTPRPRNAFILFRCDFVRQKKFLTKVEKDRRNVSRIVAQMWKRMNDKQREPWVSMAHGEKVAHSNRFTGVSDKDSKRGDDIPHDTQKAEDRHFCDDSDLLHLYRSSSCPPGTLHVPQANLESNGYGAPLKTRDDMARRPSRVTFYESTAPLIGKEGSDMNNQHYFVESVKEDYLKTVAKQKYFMEAQERKDTKNMSEQGDLGAKFCGSRISVRPYPIPGPNDPPEWDAAPTQPHTWTDWSTFKFDQSSITSGIFGTNGTNPFFMDPLLSTLPPLPHSCGSPDTFSLVDYALQPSLTTVEMETPPTSCSSLKRCKLSPDAPLEYVQNIAKYYSNTSNDALCLNNDHHYHDWSERHQKSSFSGLSADLRRALGNELDTT